MRILVLSFYFPPDLCAGSFRAGPFVEALARRVPAGSRIDVVTTLPNRYSSFTATAPDREEHGSVTVKRITLPTHRSGMVDQSRAFAAFARGAIREVGATRYDLVFATSSRLMTAVLGAWIARRSRAALYLDIRDIFADTIREVASPPIAILTAPLFSALERWAIRRAGRVNLVSGGFSRYFEGRYPRQRFSCYTNGIDPEFARSDGGSATRRPSPGDGTVTVLYAGNVGEGQGLHTVLPPLARRMGQRVRFQIVGDGGRRDALERGLAAAGATNVELLTPVPRARLLELYRAADVLFVHLNDYDAFRKVLPSKLFEYGALGKPVWAGVAGFAAEFIEAELRNSAVFAPCDVDDAIRAFDRLVLEDSPRTDFVEKYSRAHISAAMVEDVLSLLPPAR